MPPSPLAAPVGLVHKSQLDIGGGGKACCMV